MLTIRIEYRLADAPEWERVELAPEAYFDLDPRFPQGELKVTSVPRHFHAIDYLGVQASRVGETRLSIVDEAGGARREVRERFWDRGRSRIIQRHDSGPAGEDRLVILDLLVSEDPETYHILRVGDREGAWELLSHLVTRTNEDGSSSDEFRFPEPSGR
jgi:hypothetical protein